jgi:transcriptional regulator with XRE-family HTH domain
MTKSSAISLRSQWLGERLRTARERAGYKQSEACVFIQMDQTSLGRFERGTHRIRRAQVKELIDFYGVDDRCERGAFLQLAEDAWRKDWWDGDTSDLEMSFIDYTWLESRATKIYAYEPMVIYGLLQTPRYAQALTSVGMGSAATQDAINRAMEVRAERQRILYRDPPTKLTVVLEEPALRRTVGNIDVLREQLEHISMSATYDHIDVRVIPVDVPWSSGFHGPFVYFGMPDPYPEIAYIENLAGRTFLEDDVKVARFQRSYDELYRLALSPRASVDFIRNVAQDLER